MIYEVILVLHILSVVATVGAVGVVDYLHLVGMRKTKLEKKFLGVYPFISKLINTLLIFIVLTGIALVWMNQELLTRALFRVKMILFLLVVVNGFYLQKKVSPNLDKCVLKGTKYCTQDVLYSTAIAGSISVVTWFGILILSLTKNLGYTWEQFLAVYFAVLILACLTAFGMESRARKWRG